MNIIDLSNNDVPTFREIHTDLPSIPFTMACIGPSRSGKSNLIRNLMEREEMFKDIFDYIFIFCPSIDLNNDFENIETPYKFNHYSEDIVKDIMDKQRDVIMKYGKKQAPDLLFIFDDLFDNKSFTHSNLINRLCMRGRHSCISIIASGQKFSALPRSARLNLTHLCIWRPNNMNELDFLIEENINKSNKKEFEKIFTDIWNKPYEFIFFDYLNKDKNKRIRQGFSSVINKAEKDNI